MELLTTVILLCASAAAGHERRAAAPSSGVQQPLDRPHMDAVQLQRCPLMDAASLLQEHAVAMPPTGPLIHSSAWSSNALRQLRREAESHGAEDAARLFRRAGRLGKMTRLSPERRGLMLLEEAASIFMGHKASGPDGDWVRSTLQALEEYLPGHNGFDCVASAANSLVHILGGLVTIAITTKCHDGVHCTANSLEILRFFFVAMQEWKGAWQSCLPWTEPDKRCNAGIGELLANTMGIAGSITELTYKCPEYDGEHYNKTIWGGTKVTDIVCTLGLAKGGLYFAMTLSRIFRVFDGIRRGGGSVEEIWQESQQDPQDGEPGVPQVELFSHLSATCAWIAQMVFLSLGTCKEKFGRLPCYAEATEITAYVAQALAGGLSTYSYCKDDDDVQVRAKAL